MKQYHNGPIEIQKRSCTDKICLLVFFLLSAFMLSIAVYSWIFGNFKQLTTAYDPDGKGCGVNYPNYPYIYFASPHYDSLWVTVCVSECPKEGDTVLKCQPNSVVTSCTPTPNSSDNTKNVEIYDSSPTANTLCLPTSKILQQNISEGLGSQSKQITALIKNYSLILISIPIAIILALVIMILIRFLAGCFIYVLIFISIGALAGFGVYLLTQKSNGAQAGAISFVEDPKLKVIVAIICIVLAVVITVVMCCLRSRLSLASKVVEVSAVFVASNCGVVLIPFLMFIVTFVFLVLWILQALGFYSLGTPISAPQQLPFQHFEVSKTIMVLGGVHVFYLFWAIFFLIETSSFLVTGTAASWYYRRQSPYGETSQRYRSKHMGSVCFGSFFKALIGFIKFLYELLTPQKQQDENSWKAKCKSFCDCLCCLCLKIFDWINVGSYTVINVVGDDYCTSALKAASLRLGNLASSSILVVLQTIFSVIVRLGITALTVFSVYLISTRVERYKNAIQDPTLILVIVGLLAFAVSCFFCSVYSDAMESIYVTYLLDVEAGGSDDKCPDQLKNFLEEAKKEEHIVSS